MGLIPGLPVWAFRYHLENKNMFKSSVKETFHICIVSKISEKHLLLLCTINVQIPLRSYSLSCIGKNNCAHSWSDFQIFALDIICIIWEIVIRETMNLCDPIVAHSFTTNKVT